MTGLEMPARSSQCSALCEKRKHFPNESPSRAVSSNYNFSETLGRQDTQLSTEQLSKVIRQSWQKCLVIHANIPKKSNLLSKRFTGFTPSNMFLIILVQQMPEAYLHSPICWSSLLTHITNWGRRVIFDTIYFHIVDDTRYLSQPFRWRTNLCVML